jgi:hypothetical protein
LFLVYEDEEKLFIARGVPNSRQNGWRWSQLKIDNHPSIAGEPVLDIRRWKRESVLSIYSQEEPKKIIATESNEPLDGVPTPLNVVDFRFTSSQLLKPPKGRLAIVVDGNSPDPDDIGATAVIFGLLKASGRSKRLVHLSHSCDLNPVDRISAKDEQRRQRVLQQLCQDGISHFGPFENLTSYFNCRTHQQAAVNSLREAINASSGQDPLWIIEAGEPDVIGYALKAAKPAKRQYVHVVSHHPANDNSGDFFTWQQILNFGVKEHQIGDQNVGLQTPIDAWGWAKRHRDSRVKWIWKQLAYAEQDGVIKFQTNKFDCSDAGMIYWWLTGAAQGGKRNATPKEIRELLESTASTSIED